MGSRKTHDGVENVYAAADKWVECALRSDDSLFTPGKPIWTRQLLGELHTRFLDRPDAGEGSFLEKLRMQLGGSPPDVYQLMGEVLYVHYLIVWHGAIRPSTQKDRIARVLGWSSQPVAIPPDLVTCLESGIADPGIAFGTYRPYQVGAIIEFVEQWKDKESSECDLLLKDPWSFRDFLTSMRYRSHLLRNNQNTPRIQRHALLHLVYPDTFEGTVSADQKSTIANASAFAHFVTGTTDDVDRKIQQIRKGLEAELGGDFDFYDPVIRVRWDTNFNPWEEFVRRAKSYKHTGRLESREIDYKLEIGQQLAAARDAIRSDAEDWADLLKVGLASRKGHPLSWRVETRFRGWVNQSPDDALQALRAIWSRDDSSATERINAFRDKFPESVISGAGTRARLASVLLMGLDVEQYPPFMITLFRNAYRETGYEQPDQGADEAALYGHALGFLDRFIEEARQRGLDMDNYLEAQSLVWAIRNANEMTDDDEDDDAEITPDHNDIQALAHDLYLTVDFLENIVTLLEDKPQVIFQGPPGTGKTFVARKLANHLAGSEDRVTLVQFHPSYSYEDFVQGFRPTLENGQPGFEPRNGPLLRAAEQARKDKNSKHFLIIDEINRGNLARILGELYFLLEYRDEKISLQYQGDTEEKFSLPENLYIIGTMNTADRSIALVDLALRRRFYFVEFHPDHDPIKDVLLNWLKKNAEGMEWVADVVDAANDKLKTDRHAAIGPSYFMKRELNDTKVELIWEHSVLPYIEERLFGDDDRIREFDLNTLRREIGRGDTSANGEQPEGQDGGE